MAPQYLQLDPFKPSIGRFSTQKAHLTSPRAALSYILPILNTLYCLWMPIRLLFCCVWHLWLPIQLHILSLTADLAAFLLLMSPLVDDSAVFFLLMTPLIGDWKSFLLLLLLLVADSHASFLLLPCLLADSAASLLLLLLPFAIFYPVLFRNAYKTQWIFNIFAFQPHKPCHMHLTLNTWCI